MYCCPICLDETINMKMTSCHHFFCKMCLDSWLENHSDCPLCRSSLIDETKKNVRKKGLFASSSSLLSMTRYIGI